MNKVDMEINNNKKIKKCKNHLIFNKSCYLIKVQINLIKGMK